MMVIRILIGFFGAVLAALIVWAMLVGNFSAAGQWLTSDPWGIVSMADLYTGFAISMTIMALCERGWQRLFWILPVPILGNVWTAVWFVYRLPALISALKTALIVENRRLD